MDSIKRISKDHTQSDDKALSIDENSFNSRRNKSKESSDPDNRRLKGCIAKRERIQGKDTIKCYECKKNELASKTFKCFACNVDKCSKCSEKDCLITNQILKVSSYICENCFKGHLKLRKKTGQEANEVASDMKLHRKRHRKEAENISENNKTLKDQSQILDDSSLLDIDRIHEILPPPDDMEFVFNPSPFQPTAKANESQLSEYPEVKGFQGSKLEDSKDEGLLDQPLEDTPSIHIETETKHELRKSIRMKNKLEDNEINAINCHQCKKIEVTKNIITCGNESCRESFCFSCLQKYFQRILNANTFLKMKSSKDGKIWVCYKCKGECLCKACKEARAKESSPENGKGPEKDIDIIPHISQSNHKSSHKGRQKQKSRQKFKLGSSKSNHQPSTTKIEKSQKKMTTNIITIPIPENIMGESPCKNLVAIDNFILYEKESSNAEEEEAQAPDEGNITVNEQKELDESFDEYDYNIMNDKKASSQLLQASSSVEDFFCRKYKDHIVKKKCILCKNDSFHANDLLRFKDIEDFLNYLKYALIYKKNLLKSDREIFGKNKANILKYYQAYFIDGINRDWDFKEPKTACKFCFMNYLNSEDCLEKFKKILVDHPKHDMNITIINNINTQNVSVRKDLPQPPGQPTTNNPAKTIINTNRAPSTTQPLQKINLLDRLFNSSIQNIQNKEAETSSALFKGKKPENSIMDEVHFPSNFNDKPAPSQCIQSNSATQLPKFSIPQFFTNSSYKSFGQANLAVLKNLSEILVSVSNLNTESKEYFPKYSLINSQHAIQLKIEEMHKNILKLYQNVCFHRDNLNKLQTFISILRENKEFSSIQSVSLQIKEMLTTLSKWIEDNNGYITKYDEFMKRVAGGCSQLVMQINEQMQIFSLMNKMNLNYGRFFINMNPLMPGNAMNSFSDMCPIGQYRNSNETGNSNMLGLNAINNPLSQFSLINNNSKPEDGFMPSENENLNVCMNQNMNK